ncbi:MAG: DNA/RNA nuclease SfsA, partial [Atribacterota bacterium]|nr:DNA/RNA nuclease SfsA [Atribacterota bacterium]
INPLLKLKREVSYCSSRFDIMYENISQKGFIEVKGVTLEKDCIAQFPDAPTIRGTRHIQELIKSSQEGYNSYIVFVIQMKGVKYFCPNDKMDPEFGTALRRAHSLNVKIMAFDCTVEKDSIAIDQPVETIL